MRIFSLPKIPAVEADVLGKDREKIYKNEKYTETPTKGVVKRIVSRQEKDWGKYARVAAVWLLIVATGIVPGLLFMGLCGNPGKKFANAARFTRMYEVEQGSPVGKAS